MSADLIYPHDWRDKSGRKPSYTKIPPVSTEGETVSEGKTDFAALEAEIAVALWCGPDHLINPFNPEGKDPA